MKTGTRTLQWIPETKDSRPRVHKRRHLIISIVLYQTGPQPELDI